MTDSVIENVFIAFLICIIPKENYIQLIRILYNSSVLSELCRKYFDFIL